MQQKILVIGNWKMNPETVKDAVSLGKAYSGFDIPKDIELACAVPVPYLGEVRKAIGRSKIKIGVQNIYPDKTGSHTGEISLSMISHLKPGFVLIGHSERRAMGETNEFINQKVLATIKQGLIPVLCVGEKERDDHGFFLRNVEEQLKSALAGVSRNALSDVVIAYEPVWAIGKNAVREATPEECREMIIYIKKVISDIGTGALRTIPKVIYGGSVNELNAHEYISAGAEGLLPGRLSLEPKKMQKLFQTITAFRLEIKK